MSLWYNVLQILIKFIISCFVQFKITTRYIEFRNYRVRSSHWPTSKLITTYLHTVLRIMEVVVSITVQLDMHKVLALLYTAKVRDSDLQWNNFIIFILQCLKITSCKMIVFWIHGMNKNHTFKNHNTSTNIS